MSIAHSVVARASRIRDRLFSPPIGITVLIYHRVGGGSASAVDLSPGEFDEQLAVLDECYRVISLESALAELSESRLDASPAVVITFDDGTRDFTEHAVPALVRHGLPATLYVATHFIDAGEDFPWGAPPASWSSLRDAASTGTITIGSHTHSHALLDRLDAASVAADLDRSIDLIGHHVGTRPLDFAYPKAVGGSPAAEIEVRRRFRSAAVAGNRVNRCGSVDLHRLGRTPVKAGDDPATFASKASGGMRLDGALRDLIGPLRYRGATR
ncbi:MAG: polysaccharide deacetylase family protein [Ilumatobacteraceae bacterium]